MLRNDNPDEMRRKIDEAKQIIAIEEARLERMELLRSELNSHVDETPSVRNRNNSFHSHTPSRHSLMLNSAETKRGSIRHSIRTRPVFDYAGNTEEILLL